MQDLALQWYSALSVLTRTLTEPVQELSASIGLPPVTAVLLGLIGSVAPCQLTTGLSAVALIGNKVQGRPIAAGLAYVAGKALVYGALGLLFVLLGQAVALSSIPVIQVVRRLLGPLMLLVGLVLLGVLHARFTFGLGDRLAAAAADRLDASRPGGAFVLGGAFALAFCPTLFFLFFGLLVPLALVSPGGVVYPALFALGTTIPVLIVLGAVALGVRSSLGVTRTITGAQPLLTRLAGLVLLFTGLNDTVVYWLL